MIGTLFKGTIYRLAFTKWLPPSSSRLQFDPIGNESTNLAWWSTPTTHLRPLVIPLDPTTSRAPEETKGRDTYIPIICSPKPVELECNYSLLVESSKCIIKLSQGQDKFQPHSRYSIKFLFLPWFVPTTTDIHTCSARAAPNRNYCPRCSIESSYPVWQKDQETKTKVDLLFNYRIILLILFHFIYLIAAHCCWSAHNILSSHTTMVSGELSRRRRGKWSLWWYFCQLWINSNEDQCHSFRVVDFTGSPRLRSSYHWMVRYHWYLYNSLSNFPSCFYSSLWSFLNLGISYIVNWRVSLLILG